MNENLQKRLEQLINQGHEILKLKITKQDGLGILRECLKDDGPDRFRQWKQSSKVVLKSISVEGYNSFATIEKRLYPEPLKLKQLIPILKASLDDLNVGITDTNFLIQENVPSQTYTTYNIGNLGSMANHSENSTINQTSTNHLNIIKGDFSSLASNFRNYRIDEADIQKLKTIIDVGSIPLSLSEYSEDLQDWMKEMFGKSIDGSWQIAIGAAGSILASGLQSYFGF